MKLTPNLQELADIWPMLWQLEVGDGNVLIAGAFQGRVMDLVASAYPDHGTIVGYEPQVWAAEIAARRMAERGHEKWQVLPYGIGTENADSAPMGEYGTDGCSFVNFTREQGVGSIRLADAEFDTWHSFSAAVINMEGYEWELIPYLIDHDLLQYINRIAIQWHIGWGRREMTPYIFENMGKTHTLVESQWPAWTLHTRRESRR